MKEIKSSHLFYIRGNIKLWNIFPQKGKNELSISISLWWTFHREFFICHIQSINFFYEDEDAKTSSFLFWIGKVSFITEEVKICLQMEIFFLHFFCLFFRLTHKYPLEYHRNHKWSKHARKHHETFKLFK